MPSRHTLRTGHVEMKLAQPLIRWILLCISLAGCAVPTQVVVHLDIDPAEQTRSRTLRVRVWDTSNILVLDRSTPVRAAADVPLLALGEDASRTYRLVAELVDAQGCALTRQVAVGGYVAGEVLGVRLRFEEACSDVACGRDQTCIAGRCEEACFAGDDVDSNERSMPEPCITFLDPPTAGRGPVVSNIRFNFTPDPPDIRWEVTPDATGQIEYGESYTYGSMTRGESNLLPAHRQNPTGLTPQVASHFRIRSVDAEGRGSYSSEQCIIVPER